MKIFNFVTVVILFLLVSTINVDAKGTEPEKIIVDIEITLESGEKYPIIGDGVELITPSSNFLRTYKFEVPDEVLEQIDFGIYANYIVAVIIELDSGETLVGAGFLNKAGNLSFSVHKNGAGGKFPRGWF